MLWTSFHDNPLAPPVGVKTRPGTLKYIVDLVRVQFARR